MCTGANKTKQIYAYLNTAFLMTVGYATCATKYLTFGCTEGHFSQASLPATALVSLFRKKVHATTTTTTHTNSPFIAISRHSILTILQSFHFVSLFSICVFVLITFTMRLRAGPHQRDANGQILGKDCFLAPVFTFLSVDDEDTMNIINQNTFDQLVGAFRDLG